MKFIYCEIEDGGMSSFDFTRENRTELTSLYGWMGEGCRKDDEAILGWIDHAIPGDFYDHRLGMCFCVN